MKKDKVIIIILLILLFIAGYLVMSNNVENNSQPLLSCIEGKEANRMSNSICIPYAEPIPLAPYEEDELIIDMSRRNFYVLL